MDTRALLENNLPSNRRDRLAQVSRAASARGLAVYLVGGFVRDALLGLPPDDFDVVVEGDAPGLARVLAREAGGEIDVHPPFGTATWIAPDGAAMDFATARTETYARPAALPTIQPADIAADLRRRDFSINAMALRVDGEQRGELLDPFGGQTDVVARVVRVLHAGSFADDPTRLFRAVRYAGRLGFQIAPEALALVPGAWRALSALSGDRLRHEFELIFREAETSVMLTRLAELDILSHVHPAVRWGARQAELAAAIPGLPWGEWRLNGAPEPDALWLTLLLGEAPPAGAAAALAQLNVNRAAAAAVQAALEVEVAGTHPSEIVAALESGGPSAAVGAYLLHPEWREPLGRYLREWRFVHPQLTGADLTAMGLRPGPDFKRLLRALRAARLDGEVRDRAGEVELVKKLSAGP